MRVGSRLRMAFLRLRVCLASNDSQDSARLNSLTDFLKSVTDLFFPSWAARLGLPQARHLTRGRPDLGFVGQLADLESPYALSLVVGKSCRFVLP